MKKSNVIINDSIPFHFEDIQKIFHDAYGKNINEFTFINNNEIKEINETNYDDQFFKSNFKLILSEQQTKKKNFEESKKLIDKNKKTYDEEKIKEEQLNEDINQLEQNYIKQKYYLVKYIDEYKKNKDKYQNPTKFIEKVKMDLEKNLKKEMDDNLKKKEKLEEMKKKIKEDLNEEIENDLNEIEKEMLAQLKGNFEKGNLENLKKKIEEYQKTEITRIENIEKNKERDLYAFIEPSNNIYNNVMCEHCKQIPIIGYLYKCHECKQQPYYLCENCENENYEKSFHSHQFEKIRKKKQKKKIIDVEEDGIEKFE
jgi:hypothetical protein